MYAGGPLPSWKRHLNDPGLKNYAGRVSDSGEGRWTIAAAIDESVPVPVLSSALYERFSARWCGFRRSGVVCSA
jgi:6-phosphogluconate dehydrogenase (decarboxylating)